MAGSNETESAPDAIDAIDFIIGFLQHVNATLNETIRNGTYLREPEVQNFGASVQSLGLTSIIVISVACVLAFAAGCYCALKRTKRKATKIVSIRSIGNIGSQASLVQNKSEVLAPVPSSSGTQYHTPKPPDSRPKAWTPHTHTSMMWNPMCTIDCTAYECHDHGCAASDTRGGGDPGPSSIKITLSDNKIFGQSQSCSQFPDF
ncbi:hypothetical protein HOP50_01g05090 [Chloropicon primus]|uniref:Uncharacterized protein n=1 Tax=Chloropicon primus TaxID=1764295 RepID=A0A5B8MC98_9CHLO|nr:hypothetical protein A3770_01p05210 [Chloropicon primus]UPQ97218.1 hypothetical protein HOP50_01g05090 [Chloropicon primus]|eukprot:QDZ18003.1 hypothetical protein A3770_01p05210 [Chloropicon primus]